MLKMSQAGIAMLKHFERCRLEAYQDGGGVWTIGWGHTGSLVHRGMQITQQHADALLADDLVRFEAAVNVLLIPMPQAQFDALVDLAYNIGVQAFRDSTLVRELRTHDLNSVADQFLRWCLDNGKVVPGLALRRMAERLMFQGKNWMVIV